MFDLINLLLHDPVSYVIIMVAVIFGLTIHEYFHGWVAYMLGDDTAKVMGRLTVNPLAHFDPIMTTMIFIFGLGAAKPVPVNPYRLRYGQRGILMVSAAGIVANFVSALIFAFIFHVAGSYGYLDNNDLLVLLLQQLVIMNLVLLVFNLFPLPPLDGSKILLSLIPDLYKNIYSYLSFNPFLSLFLAIILFSAVGNGIINFFLKIISLIVSLFLG